MPDLLPQLQASDLALCQQAATEIIALRRALVSQARAFGQWADSAGTKKGNDIERK